MPETSRTKQSSSFCHNGNKGITVMAMLARFRTVNPPHMTQRYSHSCRLVARTPRPEHGQKQGGKVRVRYPILTSQRSVRQTKHHEGVNTQSTAR